MKGLLDASDWDIIVTFFLPYCISPNYSISTISLYQPLYRWSHFSFIITAVQFVYVFEQYLRSYDRPRLSVVHTFSNSNLGETYVELLYSSLLSSEDSQKKMCCCCPYLWTPRHTTRAQRMVNDWLVLEQRTTRRLHFVLSTLDKTVHFLVTTWYFLQDE